MNSFTMLLKESFENDNKNKVSYYLEEAPNLKCLDKVYGNIDEIIDRISDHYKECGDSSTGVLSVGHAGSGKTILLNHLSKYCREKLNLPTILITKAPVELSFKKIDDGEADAGLQFLQFIRDLPPCLIAFDEFDKTFEVDQQNLLLTMYDGAFTSKKIYIHTANSINRISDKLTGRPNRIFYKIEHGSIGNDFIREYCIDNLNDTSKIVEIIEQSYRFNPFTVDMLRAIVFEINNHKEPIYKSFKYLNLEGSRGFNSISYNITATRSDSNEKLKLHPSSISVPPHFGGQDYNIGGDSKLSIPSKTIKSMLWTITDPDKISDENPKGEKVINLEESVQEYDIIKNIITMRYKDEYVFKFEKEKITKRSTSNAFN